MKITLGKVQFKFFRVLEPIVMQWVKRVIPLLLLPMVLVALLAVTATSSARPLDSDVPRMGWGPGSTSLRLPATQGELERMVTAGILPSEPLIPAAPTWEKSGFSTIPKALPAIVDLYNDEQDALVYGDYDVDYAVHAVGDFNGDGIDDMVIYDDEAWTNRGVFVYFGATDLGGVKDVFGVEGDSPDVSLPGVTYCGSKKASDINGDGTDDLVVGNHKADGFGGTSARAGAVYVIYGSPSLSGVIDVAVTPPDVTVFGASGYNCLQGRRMPEPCDLNGDGIDDLLVGSSCADGPDEGLSLRGLLYVIFGSVSLPSTIDLAAGEQDVTIASPHLNTEAESSIEPDKAYAGDFNGDGKDDLFVSTGRRYHVVCGSPTLPTLINFGQGGGDVTIEIGRLLIDESIPPYLADVNGDAIDDFVLTRRSAGPDSNRSDSNEVHVFFGSNSLPERIAEEDDGDVVIYGGQRWETSRLGAYLYAVKPGDINGDGVDDIVMHSMGGAPDRPWQWDANRVYVVFGSSNIPPIIDLEHNVTDVTVYGAIAGDYITALNVCDVNGDDRQDLVLSAMGHSYNDSYSSLGRADGGRVYAVYGAPALPSAIDLAANEQDVTIHGPTRPGFLYASDVAGDVNDDGVDDLFLYSDFNTRSSQSDPSKPEMSIVFGIPTTSPALWVTSPNGGEYWKPGTAHNITWTSDNLAGNVSVDLYDGGSMVRTLASGVDVATESWAWSIPSDEATGSAYTIRLVSTAASLYDESNAAFSISANTPPVVNHDTYEVTEADTLVVPSAGVLLNDTDAEDDPLTAVLIAEPAHGLLTLNADGSFTYVHDGAEYDSDCFAYKANDGAEDSEVTLAMIKINGVNDPPIAEDDTDRYFVDEGGTLVVGSSGASPHFPDVLCNDDDEESWNGLLTARLVTGPLHGSLTFNSDGSFTYVHDHSDTTSDSFTYVANDGEFDSNVATVTITIIPVEDADVNGDGKLSAIDVQIVINEALGISLGLNCDVNQSGSVNAVDIQLVINAVLGV